MEYFKPSEKMRMMYLILIRVLLSGDEPGERILMALASTNLPSLSSTASELKTGRS